jgi:hypothetical protein
MGQVIQHLTQRTTSFMARVVMTGIGWCGSQSLRKQGLMGHTVPLPPNRAKQQAQPKQPGQNSWKTHASHHRRIIARTKTLTLLGKERAAFLAIGPIPLTLGGGLPFCEIAPSYFENRKCQSSQAEK